MFNRESVIRFLLRGPGALNSRIARWSVLVLAGTGAAFLVWSAVIHLMLWSDGYKDISVIGPLSSYRPSRASSSLWPSWRCAGSR